MKTVQLFGYPISAGGLQEDLRHALGLLKSTEGIRYVACANPHSIEVAERDPDFKEALLNAAILLPDGTGIILAAKLLGGPVKEKVAGGDFFIGLCSTLQVRGGARFFFLGATDHVLSLISSRLAREYPAIKVCGVFSPPYKERFSDEDNRKMVEAINKAKPDVLWVGMTAPKQEKWIYQNRNLLDVPLAAAIGAVFDFYSGVKPRSSRFWVWLGLEWLPRFLREPKRLWERNIKSTPLFLLRTFREKCRHA